MAPIPRSELRELRRVLRQVMRGLWMRRRPSPELGRPVRGEAGRLAPQMRAIARVVPLVVLLAVVVGPSAATLPTPVTLVGSLQSELGCGGDWDPTCPATHMTAGPDGIYRFAGAPGAGAW